MGISSKSSERWLRLGLKDRPQIELGNLMNLYWGGPERRITGLTLRIMGMNVIALVTLALGILFLSQYEQSLIESHLKTFGAELELTAAALAEAPAGEEQTVITRFARILGQEILLFNEEGELIIDSRELPNITPPAPNGPKELQSLEILKDMAGFILRWLPDRSALPDYPAPNSNQAADYPDVPEALKGASRLSAWHTPDDRIYLTAAAPVYKDDKILGAVLLRRTGEDIARDLGQTWLNILTAFTLTLIVTILISIYFAGIIGRPLRRLARASEGVRKGQLAADQIPDLSSRKDEIGELSKALRDMTTALSDRMDSIDRFAADVAHELKNPLSSLRSAVETLGVVKNKKDQQRLAEILKHDVERMDRLITDISHASRLDAELSRQPLEKLDLTVLLHNLLEAHKEPLARGRNQERYFARGIEITLEAPQSRAPYVWGIEGAVRQIFENLIGNALTFSPDDSVIRIVITAEENSYKITVTDQGPGIAEDKLETIFERFYSARPDHESYGQHSGLGLSICRQIARALGGEIYAENARSGGKITGARFVVMLNAA